MEKSCNINDIQTMIQATRYIIVTAALLALLVAVSCRPCRTSTEEHTTEAMRDMTAARSTDTLYVVRMQRDSVIDRDTVETVVRGDTVLRTITRWRWRLSHGADTTYRARTDTVVRYIERLRTIERRVVVERQLTAWERFRLRAFWWLVTAIAAIGLYSGIKRLRKSR